MYYKSFTYLTDHSISINVFDEYDIPCYCTLETKTKYCVSDDNFIRLENDKMYKINDIKIISFKVYHGKTECYAFIFKDKDNMILFATDFYKIDVDLKNFAFDEIFIECNYVDNNLSLVRENNDSGFLKTKYDRQLNTHCSLENLLIMLEKMNLSNCKKINLIHLSQDLGNKDLMKNVVKEKVGIYTTCLLQNGDEY